jgi:hypothetical protein
MLPGFVLMFALFWLYVVDRSNLSPDTKNAADHNDRRRFLNDYWIGAHILQIVISNLGHQNGSLIEVQPR